MKKSLYDIIGVDKHASQEDIKKAFRNKSKETHSDKGGDDKQQAEVNKAWMILRDPAKREKYDQTGNEEDQSFENKFNSFVTNVIMTAIQTLDVDHDNLIDAAIFTMKTGIDNLEKALKENEKEVLKFERVQKRVKSRGNQTIILVVGGQIQALKNNNGNIKNEIDFITQCLAVMEEYSYQVDQMTPEQMFNKHWNISVRPAGFPL
jgi:hypothetical protein